MIFLFSLLISLGWGHSEGTAEITELPLWEYGFGYGNLKLELYPTSDQYRNYSFPFPTFQYRGRILRADDQDGARAYLINRDSPLHKTDHSTSVLVGVAYVLGVSQKTVLPEGQIKGIKELIRK